MNMKFVMEIGVNDEKKLVTFFYLYLMVFSVIGASTEHEHQECNRSECKGPLRFYDDLGCSPVYSKESKDVCCPKSYSCPSFSDTDKCFANGHKYEINEKLKNDDHFNPCDGNCVCLKDNNEAKFVCEPPSCTRAKPLKVGCYYKRKLNTCCQLKKVCPNMFKFRKVSCQYDGETYSEGHEFHPANTNLMCQCERGFKGQLVAPYCKNLTCGNDIHYISKLRQNCAPLFSAYQTPNNSCNYAFVCPQGSETIIQAKNETTNRSDDNTCFFGKHKLHVGDKLKLESHCFICECELPPLVTCMKAASVECENVFSNDDEDDHHHL